ncbi:hypothetical protein WS62_10210 [Burkholderia sp. ABCPW 14]|nr:hypothetical protein WS62_10210 [Burkholderia sp. ABCPW 14]
MLAVRGRPVAHVFIRVRSPLSVMFAAARSDLSFRTPSSLPIPDSSRPLAGSRAASPLNVRHLVRAR